MFHPNDVNHEVEAMLVQRMNKPLNAGVDFARGTCRVDTGKLRDSIKAIPFVRQGNKLVGGIGTDVGHAHVNEFVYQPFLRPAADVILQVLNDD